MEAMLVDAARAYPRSCLCGSDNGPFVDTGMQHETYGAFLICHRCVKTIGATMGLASVETVAAFQNREAALVQQVADLEASLEEARAARVVQLADVRTLLAETRAPQPAAADTDKPRRGLLGGRVA